MKTLTLFRHAKSGWADLSLDDSERTLSKRGERNLVTMGEVLAGEGFLPDKILSSHAVRAMTTARGIASAIGYPEAAIEEECAIYEATTRALFEVIRTRGGEADSLALFGHNPGFEMLAQSLLYRDEIGPLVTLGVVQIRVLVDSWEKIDSDVGELISFRYPRMFDSA